MLPEFQKCALIYCARYFFLLFGLDFQNVCFCTTARGVSDILFLRVYVILKYLFYLLHYVSCVCALTLLLLVVDCSLGPRVKDMALRIHKVDVDIDFYCVTVCVWSELDSIAIWYKYLYVIGRGIDGRQKLNRAEGKFHIAQFSGNWSWII